MLLGFQELLLQFLNFHSLYFDYFFKIRIRILLQSYFHPIVLFNCVARPIAPAPKLLSIKDMFYHVCLDF